MTPHETRALWHLHNLALMEFRMAKIWPPYRPRIVTGCPRCAARRKAKAETMKRYRQARKGEGEAS